MKSKLSRFTLIFLFLALLYVPTLVWLAAGDKLATPNLENRELAAWPAFNLKKLSSLPAKYEDYFQDHLPFRNQVIGTYAKGLKTVFDDSVVTTVLFGKEDWFFYKNVQDGDPIRCYRGENLFTSNELRKIAVNLQKTRDNLKKQGIDFVLFIAPNKERVYSEYMPDRYGQPADPYMAQQLVDFLHAHTDLKVVYCYDELMQAKADFPEYDLYFHRDTHWNSIGSYIGARALMRELGVELPALTLDRITASSSTVNGDLSVLSHLNEWMEPETQYTVTDENRPPKNIKTDNRILITHSTGRSNGKKLFIRHDSFMSGMMDYVLPWFSEANGYFSFMYEDSQVDEAKPDIYLMVFVERNLRTQLLTDGPLYLTPENR